MNEPSSYWWIPEADVTTTSFKIKLASPNLGSDTKFNYQL
jgi:hypothetical protein